LCAREEKKLQDVAEQISNITEKTNNCFIFCLDVSNEKDCQFLIEFAIEKTWIN